ncbi:MAG: hypothetical protein KME55_13285 [Nostoc indistinguendum CM1-VF10]|nr:hypothetical protein [Nostoc indistinguendum CM1-VF10]
MHTIYGRSLQTVVKVAIVIIQSPQLSVKGKSGRGAMTVVIITTYADMV